MRASALRLQRHRNCPDFPSTSGRHMHARRQEDALRLPVIDLSLARSGATWTDPLAAQIDWAASEFGFFYVIGHDVDARLIDRLQSLRSEEHTSELQSLAYL